MKKLFDTVNRNIVEYSHGSGSDLRRGICFICKRKGHTRKECPESRDNYRQTKDNYK